MTIRLVPFGDDHVAGLEETWLDPDVLRFTSTPDPMPADWMTTWRAQFDGATKIAWAVVDDEVAERVGFVGYAVAFGIDREAGEVELGYATAPWARGRGVATATLRLLTRWALGEGMQRLALRIVPENIASRRVAETCGYTFEGVLRSLHNPDGSRSDLQSWSLLPGDLVSGDRQSAS